MNTIEQLKKFTCHHDLPCQIGYQSEIDFNEWSYIFKLQCSASNYITIATNDIQTIKKIKEQFNHLYEVIPENVPVKEYVDIDFYIPVENQNDFDFEFETETIIHNYLDIRNGMEVDKTTNKKIHPYHQ